MCSLKKMLYKIPKSKKVWKFSKRKKFFANFKWVIKIDKKSRKKKKIEKKFIRREIKVGKDGRRWSDLFHLFVEIMR